MLWHENAGWHGTILSEKVPPPSSSPSTKGMYQEPVYSSIRRMVVVKEQRGWLLRVCVRMNMHIQRQLHCNILIHHFIQTHHYL